MISSIETLVAIEQMAHKVTTWTPSRWAGFVIYFLEALEAEGGVGSAGFRAFLKGVQDSIAARLERGRW